MTLTIPWVVPRGTVFKITPPPPGNVVCAEVCEPGRPPYLIACDVIPPTGPATVYPITWIEADL